LNENSVAHIAFVKQTKVTIANNSLDYERLANEINNVIPSGEREDYAIITGYIVFNIKTDFYQGVDAGADAGTTGIKISGDYFKKSEESLDKDRVVAIWTSIRFTGTHSSSNNAQVASQSNNQTPQPETTK